MENTKKTVLVTGVGGFMGSHVLRHILQTTDWNVVGMDSFRHRGKTDRVSQQLEGMDSTRYTQIRHDLTVPFSEQMKEKLSSVNYVLSIASESHVDRSITEPRPFVENNVALILTLLEWMREGSNVEKFIHISTDEVYGPAYDHNHKEGEPHRPSNPYSASKAAQEAVVYSYWRTYNLPLVITNTMNIIGEMQDTEKFIPMTIKKILAGEEVTVHVSPEGVPGSRYYLHARNQADALVYLLQNHTPTRYPATDIDRFNVVGEKEVNNLEMVELISEILGKPANVKEVDFHSSRPGHDLRYGLDGAKMESIGWKAPLSFYDSLKSTIEWTLNHKEWTI